MKLTRTFAFVVAFLFAGASIASAAESVHLYLKPVRGGKTYQTTVAADGSFSFPEVESGEYEIRLELKEYFETGDVPTEQQRKKKEHPSTIEIESFSFGASNMGSARSTSKGAVPTADAGMEQTVRTGDLSRDGMQDVVVAVMDKPLRKGSKIKMSTGDEAGTLKGSLGIVTITASGKKKEFKGHVTLLK